MALSTYKQAVYASLATPEERKIIDRFYAMSHQEFLKSYRQNMGELIDRFDRTRLWPHQKDNISFRHERLKKKTPPKGFITTLPAGAGKTEIFVQSILENAIEVTEDDKVKLITPPMVILVPSEDLVKQTQSELLERAPNLMIGVDYGKEKNIQPLTVTTYDTFIKKVEEGDLRPGDINLMVMDEGHRGLSETRLEVFRRFVTNSLIDAYSASPAFDSMKNLYALLGKESVIPGPSDRELTSMGHLAECHNVLLRVSINTDDLPEALKNNPERYNDFLEELKIQAAKEFYLTYADEKTGQRAFGKPAVGFTKFVRHANRAAEVFDEALRTHAAQDKRDAKILGRYTHPTQVLSRSMGDKEVDAAFNRILPAHKRNKHITHTDENLITFTTKMAREGTNVPRWKVAIGIQTPNSSVDQVQTRGRARRKTGDELSFVLDVFVEEDGKIRGKPKFYYEAIDDPSIVRGVVSFKPGKDDIDGIVADVMEFKNRKEMKELVLGNSRKHGAKFDALWDNIISHIQAEEKKPKPKPYMLDGEPVTYKIVPFYRDDEEGNGHVDHKKNTEIRISQKMLDQFRSELDIPGQVNSTWKEPEAFEEAVIGKKLPVDADEKKIGKLSRINGERAEHYAPRFNTLLTKARRHFEEQRGKKNPEPLNIGGEPLRMSERLDEAGNTVLAFHVDGVQQFKRALDVAPTQGRRFYTRKEFEEAVLEGVQDQAAAKREITKMWASAEGAYRKQRKPGTRCFIPFCDGKVEAANCFMGEGKMEFCLDRLAIAAARRALDIAAITFDPATIKWEKDITAVEQIAKLRDGTLYPEKTADDLTISDELPQALRTGKKNSQYAEWRKKAEADLDAGKIVKIGGYKVELMRSGNITAYCLNKGAVPDLAKTLGIELRGELRDKTLNDLTLGSELPKALGITQDNQKYVEWRVRAEANIDSGKTVEINGYKIERVQSGARTPYCINKKAVPELAKILGIELIGELRDKTLNDLTLANEIPEALKIGTKNSKYVEWRTKVLADLDLGKKVTIGEHTIELLKSGARTTYCLNKDAVPALAKIIGVELSTELRGEVRAKTSDDLTLTREVPAALKIGIINPKYIEWRTQAEADLEAGKTVAVGGYKIEQMLSGSNLAYCLNKDAMSTLAKTLGLDFLREKTPNDLTLSTEIPAALKTSASGKKYTEWRTQAEADLGAGKTVTVGGHKIELMRAGNINTYCLNKESVSELSKILGFDMRDKNADDLTIAGELPKALKTTARNQRYADWLAKVEGELDNGKTVEIGGYKIERVRSGFVSSYCLNKGAVPILAKALGFELRDKTSDDLTLSVEIPIALKIGRRAPHYTKWLTKVERELDSGKIVEIGGYKIERVRSGTGSPYCLNKEAIPALKEELTKMTGQSEGSDSPHASKVTKHSIDPNSHNIRTRTGRTRKVGGEE